MIDSSLVSLFIGTWRFATKDTYLELELNLQNRIIQDDMYKKTTTEWIPLGNNVVVYYEGKRKVFVLAGNDKLVQIEPEKWPLIVMTKQ